MEFRVLFVFIPLFLGLIVKMMKVKHRHMLKLVSFFLPQGEHNPHDTDILKKRD